MEEVLRRISSGPPSSTGLPRSSLPTRLVAATALLLGFQRTLHPAVVNALEVHKISVQDTK